MLSRRKHLKSGIKRGPDRSWPKHEKWVRGHVCAVPLCATGDRIEFCHVRSAANAGMGLKPASWWGIPLCASCHATAHRIGHDSFARLYGLDLMALARQLAEASPDLEMKKAMRYADDRHDG